ncbi:MAG: DoxX family protein [Gammaproteobacteria bacterium]
MPIKFIAIIIRPFLAALDALTPVGDLLARCWVAYIFFNAGLVKIQSWDTTVSLFTYEYHVPLLPPYLAAVLGTAAELILPVLLVIGLGGRLMILVFFIYNIIAVTSYSYLWTPQGEMGLYQHIDWGLLLALLMFHGSGKISVDYWLRQRHGHHLLTNGNGQK